MQESSGRESSKTKNDSEHDATGADSEATSKETLSDLEEKEGNVESGGSGPDPGPSPDGALDEPDEIKDAGPI